MKKLLNRMPFMYRILLGCVMVALVPLVLYNVLTLNMFSSRLRAESDATAQRQLGEMNVRLAELFEAGGEVSARVSGNGSIARALIDNTNDHTTSVNLLLYRESSSLPAGVDIALYDAGGYLRFATNSGAASASLPLRWGLLHKALSNGGMVFASTDGYTLPASAYSLYSGEALYGGDDFLVGYTVVGYTQDAFRTLFAGLFDEQSAVLLFDERGELVYASRQYIADEELTEVRRWLAFSGTGEYTRGNDYYYIAQNGASGYYLTLRQQQPITSSGMGTLRSISIITALVSFGLCILFSVFISRSLSKPLQKLTTAMRSLRKGDLDARVDTNRQDELGQLSQSFNRMADELNDYMQRIVDNQREMDEAQIRLLQAQLNPHFLYNTLDTVKWLAKIHNVPQIATITANLAIILRQCVSGEDIVPLSEELDMIESYTDIQRIRFSGRFEYTVDVPEALLACRVPKLILQPVVENAIIHGLADKESGYIYIYANSHAGTLQISVTDDGCGMPPEEVARLNDTSADYHAGHLGLHNVNHIIKTHYGREYGLRFHSIVGTGTTVTLELPMEQVPEQEEEAHV